MVSIIDHERMVSLILKLKYSLKSQKPVSFTCENSRLPAPTDRTIKLGLTLYPPINGARIPAVVKPATVAEPKHTRIMAAINQAKISGGTLTFFKILLNCSV